jgi:hypothetical protein
MERFFEHRAACQPDMRNAGVQAEQNQAPAGEVSFIDEKQLLARLPVSCRTLLNP